MSRVAIAGRHLKPHSGSYIQDNLSFGGWVLFAIGLSLIGSAFTRFRYSIGGLLVHPYLAFVIILLPLLAASRLRAVPSKIVMTLSLFAGLYFASTFSGGVSVGEGMKLGASVATILVCAMLVRSPTDFVMGTAGMLAAMGALAFIGISADTASGGSVNAIETANKNTYSLYALPPLLVGVYILLRQSRESFLAKSILLVCSGLVTLCIALSTNRSGWLGLGVIVLFMTYERSIKAAIGFLFGGALLYFVITSVFSTDHLTERADDLGNESDHIRFQLITTSLQLGLQYPLSGVSPQELSRHLARAIHYSQGAVESHNVYALIIGGCGIVAFLVFMGIAYELWSWPPPRAVMMNSVERRAFLDARKILRYTLLLYAIRGMFTAEILFSPGFNMTIGLCIGLVICIGERAERAMLLRPLR